MRFDHAGIATDDASGLTEMFADLLAVDVVHEERVDGMDVVFLDCEGGFVELLEPRARGPIADYLERNGPGIHHVAFETGDIEGALDRATDLGIDLVDEEPRPGARGHSVAFLHPRSTGGVLIEFVEH